MEFDQVVNKRQSIRVYQSKMIDSRILDDILDTINKAPSAGNLQGYQVYVVKELDTRLALAKAAYNQEFISQAPVNLVFCADPDRSQTRYGSRGRNLYCVQDATIACCYAMLAAANNGLGSVWVGAFDEKAVREVISVSEVLVPVAILPIGYSAEKPERRSRRDLEDLVTKI